MITPKTTIAEVIAEQEWSKYQKYMIYGGKTKEEAPINRMRSASLESLADIGWSPEGIAAGLNFFLGAIREERVQQYFVYEDTTDDPLKADVNFIHISPKEKDREKPMIILCAGGGYQSVCTMVEAIPTARHLIELGYEVFLFTYRVNVFNAAQKALDDLAAGIEYLYKHKEEMGISSNDYAIGGFSAGANLISNWGSSRLGYGYYQLPKPLCMFPVYTYIDLKAIAEEKNKIGILVNMFGASWKDRIDEFQVTEQINDKYPPCYIVCGKNDTTVACVNSEIMEKKLEEAGVIVVLEEGEEAQHGFGDGTGTDVEGWPKRAINFMENLLLLKQS